MNGVQVPQVATIGQGPALVPFPVEPERKTTQSSGGSRSFGELSPEQRANLDEQRALNEQTIAAAEREKQARVELARIQEQEAAELGAIKAEEAARKAKAAEEGEAAISAVAQRAQSYKEEYENTKIKDFWEDKSTGQRVLAAIAMGLGAAGAIMGGGRNYAMEIIQGTIERDYQRQTSNIDRLKDRYVTELTGIKDAVAARDRLKENAALEAAAKYQATAAKWAQAKAKLGVPLAEIEGDKNIATLKQNGLDKVAEGLKPTARRIEENSNRSETQAQYGASGPKLTEGQAKSADLGQRMAFDEGIISGNKPMSQEGLKRLRELAAVEAYLEKNPGKRAALVRAGALKTPEQLLNDQDRLVYQAGRRFAASSLRGDSGASIALTEYLNFADQYLPTLGDKGGDISTKAQARQQLIRGKMVGAGPAGGAIQAPTAAPAPAAAPEAVPKNSEGTPVKVKDKETGAIIDAIRLPDGTLIQAE